MIEAGETRLDLASSDSFTRGGIWTIVGDVALSLVLVLVLFVLAQFLQYQRVFVLEEIDRRKQVVEELVRQAAATVLLPAELADLTIVDGGFTVQRIRFPEAMLFGSCEVVPGQRGAQLIEAVGRALADHSRYFEAVQIEGHADRRPPVGACRRLVTDNWGLSSARATEFVRVLVRPGVFSAASLVSAVGRGDTQPLTTQSATDDDLEQDRRIELILVYSESDARDP